MLVPFVSVSSVRYSGDGLYVYSGSEDMNVRIWKGNASQQLGTVRYDKRWFVSLRLTLTGFSCQALPREKRKAAFDAALVSRYAHVPDIKRIARCAVFCSLFTCTALTHQSHRQRHVPKAIHKASQLRHTMEESQRVKRENVAKHSAAGHVAAQPARKERIVAELR